MIKKVLIANRGEIAIRIMRTLREMGIRSAAVYSDADKNALHTLSADEAVHIGPPESQFSYLNAERIITAAKEIGADAIHPGYGFLSERAEFVDACEDAGIIFIGPPSSAMRALGAKIEAKQLAVQNSVPVTPGFFVPGAADAQLKAAADKMGYPIMIKASAGGGGRGMRAIFDPAEFDSQLSLAKEESLKAFGDDAMMVEKLIERPRHVEVQIFADKHGNAAALFERECSIQRRHQKLIEEAPSPYVSAHPDIWPKMQQASISLALAAGYVGAGTVEFMVDDASGEFYFLEINARLQVEHPVTEAITGLDLVRLQIEIANGAALPDLIPSFMTGDRSNIHGHAIECRIIAEDPGANFMPSVGPILAWAPPLGPGIRVDSGYDSSSEVSQYYDSMLAKLIAYAPTRDQAISKSISALEDFHILGVKTNIGYHIDVLSSTQFMAGETDTGLLGRKFSDWVPPQAPGELTDLYRHSLRMKAAVKGTAEARTEGVWDSADGWRIGAGKN